MNIHIYPHTCTHTFRNISVIIPHNLLEIFLIHGYLLNTGHETEWIFKKMNLQQMVKM